MTNTNTIEKKGVHAEKLTMNQDLKWYNLLSLQSE